MKHASFLLLLIIIIASFLRLYNITQLPPGLYPDEAMNGNNALEALSPGGHFKVFYQENNGREGLFINIQALSLKLFGNEPWALRVVSAIFGILTVLGVYLLAKELFSKNSKSENLNSKQIPNYNIQNSKQFRISDLEFRISYGEKIALLSSFFLAVSFWHINFSRISFRAIMAPFFITWALYFFFKALNKSRETSPELGPNIRTKGRHVLYSILGGVFFGLGFYSYIAYRAMPALMLVIFFYHWFKRKDSRKKLIAISAWFILATFIVALPIGIYFLKNPADFMGRTTEVSIFSSGRPLQDLASNVLKTAGMFNIMGDWNWRHNLSGRPELDWLAGLLFLVGIAICLHQLFSAGKNSPLAPSANANPDVRPQNAGLFGETSGQRELDREKSREETDGGFFLALFLFSFLIIAALPVVVSNEGIPHALRSIIMIPPVFILAGTGGIWLYAFINLKFENLKLKKIFRVLCFMLLVLLVIQSYYTYFILWGKNPNVQGAFNADYAQIGYELRNLPKDLPKYVVVEAPGVLVRGIPMPAQTVMFLTDTFTPEKQAAKNIHYILPQDASNIPAGAYTAILK